MPFKHTVVMPMAALLATTAMPVALATPVLAQQDGESSTIFMEEVIVTARKRDERLLDVPMSVNSYSGELLDEAGINNVRELFGVSAGVYFTAGTFGTDGLGQQILIRGVGATPIIEPAVGVFVDGVYQPSLGFDMDFVELERVEILKGPQGTLFGRNTQAGAMNIVTKKPSDELDGRVRVGYDEFNTLSAQAYLSSPLSDKIGFSVLGKYEESDGFVDNTTLGIDQNAYDMISGRLRVFMELTDNLTLDLTADGSEWEGGSLAGGIPTSLLDDLERTDNAFQENETTIYGFSGRLDWTLDSVVLTSITAYRDTSRSQFLDMDVSAANINEQNVRIEQGTFSQELRIASNTSGNLYWSAGAYYFDESRDLFQRFAGGGNPLDAANPFQSFFTGLIIDPEQSYLMNREGYAFFGQASYTAGDFEFTAGLRYSDEDSDMLTRPNVRLEVAPDVFVPLNVESLSNDAGFDAFTPMASVRYSVNDEVSTYFTYARGFKSGGFQDFATAIQALEPFDNEFSESFELGLKAEFFNRRLVMNASVYYVDIRDQQIRYQDFAIGAVPLNVVVNLGASHTQGMDLDFTAYVTDDLTLRGAFGWVQEAEYDRLDIAPEVNPFLGNLEGQRFSQVPEITASLQATYVHQVNDDTDLTLFGGFLYVDDTISSPQGVFDGALALIPVDSYVKVDVRATLSHKQWAVTAFVDNLFDERIVTTTLPANLTFEDTNVIEPPRRVGVMVSYDF